MSIIVTGVSVRTCVQPEYNGVGVRELKFSFEEALRLKSVFNPLEKGRKSDKPEEKRVYDKRRKNMLRYFIRDLNAHACNKQVSQESTANVSILKLYFYNAVTLENETEVSRNLAPSVCLAKSLVARLFL